MRNYQAGMAAAIAFSWAGSALADCSRPMDIPVSPFGYSVVINNGNVSGIYPELLLGLQKKIGCAVKWYVVPRARLEALFEHGKADMLLAATHSQPRDRSGRFIPFVYGRATLISLGTRQRPPISSMQQLIEQKSLRVVLVRGFDYGPAYQDLIRKLSAENRLLLVPDAINAARMLVDEIADATIMPPSVILHDTQDNALTTRLHNNMRVEALKELPWIESGIYLSTKSLTPSDVEHLSQTLTTAARSGVIYQAYVKLIPAEILKVCMRPLSWHPKKSDVYNPPG